MFLFCIKMGGIQLWMLAIVFLLLSDKYISHAKDITLDQKPNIIIIMADDMGFDDISFRGSNQFLTPNIDALAYSGIILNNLYAPSMCTPSRSALLTGKYPIHTGMQHYVIPNDQPWGLPTNETTIAEIFKANGYYTSLIGKWHLGMSRQAYTPTMRGFDKHYGYLGSYIDYYDQTLYSPYKNYSRGHDFRDDLDATRTRLGTYVTDILTEATTDLIAKHDVTKKPLFLILSHLAPHSANEDHPLQAPDEEIQKFAYINDIQRRTYAAMMSILDASVGKVVGALHKKGILNNTIILFYSDNGGPTVGMHSTTASNYPLRGQKNSPWEGGLRTSAAIWSTQFEKLGAVWRQKFYIADFLPTLAAAANIEINKNLNIDGLNLWSALKYGYESVEREIVHNIDNIFQYISYVNGKWKLINGTTENGQYDRWLGGRTTNDNDAAETDPRSRYYNEIIRNTTVWKQLAAMNMNSNEIDILQMREDATVACQFADSTLGVACSPLEEPCLFDIDLDPCEQNNLFVEHKNTKFVKDMLDRVKHFRYSAHQPNNKPTDVDCDPRYYNYEWTWWEDINEISIAIKIKTQYSLQFLAISIILVLLQY